MPEHVTHPIDAKAITQGPKHHFFGYYEKCPWDVSGRYVLGMEIAFMDRMPRPEDDLTLGLVDTANGNRFKPFATTRAWCWQQGTMLQWLPATTHGTGAPNLPGPAKDCVIYNQREKDQFVSVIRDVHTGRSRQLPRAIYALDPQGRYALSLNFARLAKMRPGYGYEGLPDPWENDLRPSDDGIYRVDLYSGEVKLVFSVAQAYALTKPRPSMDAAKMWFNHIQVNADGSRFAVLNRWQVGRSWHTRCLTLNPDGSHPQVLADDEFFSHYDWRGTGEILGWCSQPGQGKHYYLFTDRTSEARIVGKDVFQTDGHCSFSPDRKWMLTDTYPDKEQKRTLVLYEWDKDRRVDIGRFLAPPQLEGPLRCDLHPRWSRDGKKVCIDSAHENVRQMYVLDVAEIVAG